MTVMVAPPEGGHAPAVVRPSGPNPGGLASPQNKAPKAGAAPKGVPLPKIGNGPKTAAGRVAASRAAGTANDGLISESPAALAKLASASAAKIYNPIMANYTAQMNQTNGLAQKRTADVTAFGQWYGQQQQALAAQEQERQTALSNLLGQINPATTPQNGIQSSIGTNMNATTGGAVGLEAAGNNALSRGILSTDALNNESNTNNSQNELSALGGAYQQNMMSAISSDLTKTDTSIEDAQSKALSEEGTNAARIDTNLTSYINDQNKNSITASYDQQQANAKEANQIIAAAKATGIMTPSMAVQLERLTGSLPTVGATAATQQNQQKLNLTQFNDLTTRLKANDSYQLGQVKNLINQEAEGVKAKLTNAEITKDAAAAGQSRGTFLRDVAYAYHYGIGANGKPVGGNAAGGTRTPYTTDEATTQLAKVPNFGNEIDKLMAGQLKGVPAAKTPQAVRTYLNGLGAKASPLLWVAYDMKFNDGKITPRTHQMLLNIGFTPAQLRNYQVAPLKVK